MDTVNYGLIGCGMMGREHIQNINLLPQGQVSVVYDPVADLAASAAILAEDALVAASLDDLLAFENLDAVVIVSPNYLHVSQLQDIVAKRPMPILCEKPLYTQASDAAVFYAPVKEYHHPVLGAVG